MDNKSGILRDLAVRLESVNWAIIGSTGLELHAKEERLGDIDILTDSKEAYVINNFLKALEVVPVSYSESSIFRSHFGKFKIGMFDIEVMGDMEYFASGKWHSMQHIIDSHTSVELEGLSIPVAYLEDLMAVYKDLKIKGYKNLL